YHQYFAEFLNTVDVQAIIDNAYNLIKPYVEKDPTAFFTYEEFETGVETMRQFCALRSDSISMQLTNGETTSNMSYVDASALTLSDMGSMGGKGGFGGMPEGFEPPQMPDSFDGMFPGTDSDITTATPSDNQGNTNSTKNNNRPSSDNIQMPVESFNPGMNSTGNTASSNTNLIWLAVSVLILGVGLLIAKLYKY
ncbi:MAG: hypothetical protein IJB67_06545, partial [Firmicutes bacterium]|nr:hypothetical protein [Bacillota bacterium]